MDTNLEMSVCLGLGFAWSPLLIPQWYIYAWGENCQKSKKRVPTFWQLLWHYSFWLHNQKNEIFFFMKYWNLPAMLLLTKRNCFSRKDQKYAKKQLKKGGTNFRVVVHWTQTPKCGFGLGFWSIRKKNVFASFRTRGKVSRIC